MSFDIPPEPTRFVARARHLPDGVGVHREGMSGLVISTARGLTMGTGDIADVERSVLF
jgi:hypothetical protein